MATKLGKSAYPSGVSANDLKCFGPTATKDTEFSGTRMADMGCFMQEGVDSNKYYHCCICQHKSTGKWYLYVEYGRVGAKNPQFQFTECHGEADAQQLYEKQCAEKNTNRGQWQNIGGVQLFRPRADNKGKPKDLYVVRDLAKRDVGLPDGRVIASSNFTAVAKPKDNGKKSKPAHRCDNETTKLMRDLIGGTISYTKASIQGGTIPTQRAIDQGRDLITNVLKRIANVGNNIQDQISDKEIRDISYALYGLIPKVKALHCPDEDWILSDFTSTTKRQSNISLWQEDLDAFESALKSADVEEITHGDDPMDGIPADMEWIDPKSELGQYLMLWWPKATRNRHANVGEMRIKNLWKVDRHGDDQKFRAALNETVKTMPQVWNEERPLHQDKKRSDLSTDDRKLYWETNTALVFHGSRSVNIASIIRENLRLPKDLVGVVITGALLGGGLYTADDVKKSIGYTSAQGSYWSGGGGSVKGRHAFMFACDTIMGVPHIAPGCHGYTTPPQKHHSVFGKAAHTKLDGWGGSTLKNNEWVVYKQDRLRIRYLAEFTC